jgi:hypothetical protein
MKYICAQPATSYYKWQIEVMINNFLEKGIKSEDIHILCGYTQSSPPIEEWKDIINKFNKVNFFFYLDDRHKPSYIPSVRPHILYKHWLKHPKLENETIFYHDCDIVFTKPVDFKDLLEDNKCYVSDTISYIGAKYIRSKGEKYFNLMTNIVNINKKYVIEQEENSGGAQYLLKNIPIEFWKKVYYDSENLFRLINNEIKKDKIIDPSFHEIQIWCADMWAVLWNLWFWDKQVLVTDKLSFSWATSPIEDWDKYSIFHNAGVEATSCDLFYKEKYRKTEPYNIELDSYSNKHCSYNYVKEILKVK